MVGAPESRPCTVALPTKQVTNGGMIVVALAARPDSGKFDDGTTDLTTMAGWLNANLEALPAGRCIL
jgi:hypothetical protein